MRFQDRVVLVTGGSRGLGAELARGFQAEGARVIVSYRVQEKRATAVSPYVVQLDLADRSGIESAVADVVEAHGRLDVLINNAARTGGGFFGFSDGLEELVAVDLIGAGAVARAAVRAMLPQGSGVILNVGSVASERPPPGWSAYATAKGGLLTLTRAMARELAARGIRVNALVPGILDVGSAARMPRDEREAWLATVPLGRAGRAEEAVEAALWICSDAARYVVGHALRVDGGLAIP